METGDSGVDMLKTSLGVYPPPRVVVRTGGGWQGDFQGLFSPQTAWEQQDPDLGHRAVNNPAAQHPQPSPCPGIALLKISLYSQEGSELVN